MNQNKTSDSDFERLKKQREMTNLLKKGYQEMAVESKKIMRDFSILDKESLKYID